MGKHRRVPVVVARARYAIGNVEAVSTWEDLQCAIPSKDLWTLQHQVRDALTEMERYQYKMCSKDQKASVIKQYLIDPKEWQNRQNGCSSDEDEQFIEDRVVDRFVGINSLMNSSSKTDLSAEWLHRSEIKKRLHDDAMGDILCDSGELPERPSEYKCFADKGYKQYYLHRSRFRLAPSQTNTSGNVTKAELTPHEVMKVIEDMESNFDSQLASDSGGPPIKKPRTGTGKQESPEALALQKAYQVWQTALHNWKKKIDKN